jgi:hypothetical protein
VIDSVEQELGRTTPFTPSSLSGRSAKASVPAANLTYAYAGFGAVLGVLFGVATAVTLHQNGQTAEVKTIVEPPIVISDDSGVVQASFAAPEEKDMGSVNSLAAGLRGHLTTTWSERLSYKLVVAPSEAAQNEAFAQTVNDPPRPLSVDLQLKSAAGQVLCDQQVVLKYDPSKTSGVAHAQLSRLEAQELDREHASDVFQNDMDKDGKIASISSQGTIPCSKQDYEATAFWTFAPQFPDLREQAQVLKRSAAAALEAKAVTPKTPAIRETATSHPVLAAVKLPVAPKLIPAHKAAVAAPVLAMASAPVQAAPAAQNSEATAEVQAPAPFHFEIEGDDEIVDFDAAQKSLETSAGKTFFVSETLAASSVAGWLDEQANVHYRCDEKSSCTLSLASASTVLHATMRSHHATLAEGGAPAAPGSSSNDASIGLVSFGR